MLASGFLQFWATQLPRSQSNFYIEREKANVETNVVVILYEVKSELNMGKVWYHWGVILRLLLTCQAGDEGKQAKHMEKESDHHGHQGHWWQKHGSNNTRKHQPWFPGKDHYCCFHVVVYLHLGRHALCFCQR